MMHLHGVHRWLEGVVKSVSENNKSCVKVERRVSGKIAGKSKSEYETRLPNVPIIYSAEIVKVVNGRVLGKNAVLRNGHQTRIPKNAQNKCK